MLHGGCLLVQKWQVISQVGPKNNNFEEEQVYQKNLIVEFRKS